MRPPAKAHDPKRASISVSAKSYDRITRVAGQLGVSRGKLVEAHIKTFLDEQNALINAESRASSHPEYGETIAMLQDHGEQHVMLRIVHPYGVASIALTGADLNWLIERARHLKGKL